MVMMYRSRLATLNICDALRVCHDMVVELLLHTPACIHLVSKTPSKTSHTITSAAISRSNSVMQLVGFVKVTILRRTSSVQFILHTIGANAFMPGIQTPPAPLIDAPRVALYSASPGTSLFTCVGSVPVLRMIWCQSWNISRTSGHRFQNMLRGFISSSWLIGPKSNFPAGTPMAAWRSFMTSFSTRFKGTPL